MEVRTAFTFLSEDPAARRTIGLAALLSLAPGLATAVTGYRVRLARRVAADEPHPLPAWDDLGSLWKEGLGLDLALLTYAGAAGLLIGLPLLGAWLSISWAGDDPTSALPVASIMLLVEGAALLAAILLPVLSFLWPAITALYVHTPRTRTCFQLGPAVRLIARHPSAYTTLWGIPFLLSLAAAALLSPVMILLAFIPCLGALVACVLGAGAAVVILLVSAHLEGQFISEAGLRTPAAAASPDSRP